MSGPSEDLAQRFRKALPEAAPDASVGCPPADELWAAAAGELPFERVRALVDHGARCAACAEEWRILADVRAAAAMHGSPGVSPTGALRLRAARRLVPLGLLALAAGLVLALRTPGPRPAPVERGTGGAGLHAESAEVQPSSDAVLRWSQVAGARSYDVTVLTQDLNVVHQARGVAGTTLRLPADVARRGAGTELLWNVDALLQDGRTVSSPTFEVRLR